MEKSIQSLEAKSGQTPIDDRDDYAWSDAGRLFLSVLDRHLSGGQIRFKFRARTATVGPPQTDVDPVVVRIHNTSVFRRALLSGNLGLGEAYMDGQFDVDQGRLPELLTLLLRSDLASKIAGNWRFLAAYLWVQLRNLAFSASANVRRHYDIGEDLFDGFLLDRYQVYSCGYATSVDDDIDRLQSNKLDRICRKLDLKPGQRLLDIGCGYGGLLIHAARQFGVQGTGVTNSRAHFRRARAIIERLGLADRVSIVLGDFRESSGDYDRIVSVGMMEHLRPREYRAYFVRIARALRPGGWGLVHTIGLNDHRNRHDPFIQKYVFPGSDTPRLSAMAREIERNRMAIIDVENIVRHYGHTVRRWLSGFRQNCDRLDPDRYPSSFQRLWEYYLSCGIAAAEAGNLAVYQVLFTNDYYGRYRLQRV